ncbi:MAG TPA: cytochrome P460 family protein [Verrucomicrobiae bacterium]|nr:cytochrome P460 family protein [Verrucomicrobiae bacterium]
MKKTIAILFVLTGFMLGKGAESEQKSLPGPADDRIGFPEEYKSTFQVLRVFQKQAEGKVVTVYGNKEAASVTSTNQLPYPYGSVIVMETARADHEAQGSAHAGKVLGLHVMRRGKGFGEAYGKNRAGEWEFVEYRPDRTYITTPAASGTCAQCHVKAGAGRDFVYRGRLAPEGNK